MTAQTKAVPMIANKQLYILCRLAAFVADVVETLLLDLVGPDTVCVAEPVLLAVAVRSLVAEALVVGIPMLFVPVPTLPVGLMPLPLSGALEIAVPLTTAQIFGGIAAKTAMSLSQKSFQRNLEG